MSSSLKKKIFISSELHHIISRIARNAEVTEDQATSVMLALVMEQDRQGLEQAAT
jgi:hypothetical protein